MPVLRKHEKYCDDVRRLSEAGLSDSEIAEHFGVVTRTVANWRKRYCIPPAIMHRRSKTEPYADTIIAMRKAGALHHEIASEIGVSEAAISRFFRRHPL